MSSHGSQSHAFPVTFSSSVADDVWHDEKGPFAFESWQFDALSDDGRQALVISFYDNYPFSPRYLDPLRGGAKRTPHPAVSLVYSVDGKAVLNAVNESAAADLRTADDVRCTIGDSWFRVDTADYGTGYVLNVELTTARRRRVKVEVEWLAIEADLFKTEGSDADARVFWNIVSPRSDVSGRITVHASTGDVLTTYHFRGTGCHDHLRSKGLLDEVLGSRCWGRGHFVDATAVFQCIKLADGCDMGRLFVIKDRAVKELEAQVSVTGHALSRFGIKVPKEITFYTDEGFSLAVTPVASIDSGFCEVKLVSKMRMTDGDEKPHESDGILSILSPGRLRRRLIRRLSGLRIGTDDRPPLF